MSAFNLSKSTSLFTSTIGLIALSNLTTIDSAHAFSVTFNNGGFESSIGGTSGVTQNSWNTIGDVTTSPAIYSISPTNGARQAIVTTGYTLGSDSGTARDDDNGLTFKKSNNNPVNADTNSTAQLQNHFDFSSNAFSIDRSAGATFPGARTSKEGSGMYQDFSVTLGAGETSFDLSFDWAFLSNDGTTASGGDQDFAFWSIGQIDGNNYTTDFNNTGNPGDEIIVLKSSSSATNIENTASPTTVDNYLYESDYATNGRETYTVDGLAEGQTYNYRLGYGVVDVDGLDRTSTLMIDNIEAVPFEFSPSFGLLFVAGLFGLKTTLNRAKKVVQK